MTANVRQIPLIRRVFYWAKTHYFALLLVLLGLLVLAGAAMTVPWRTINDQPIMFYYGYLIDHGYVPYRDFFDINLPAAYSFYWIVLKTLGYSDLGFRLVDLLYLALTALVTGLWLRRFGWKTAWCSGVLFAAFYLALGPATSLERDYLTLLPASASIWIATSLPNTKEAAKNFLIGLLWGVIALIRVNLALGFLVLLLFQITDSGQSLSLKLFRARKTWLTVFWAGVGFSIPFALAFVYLWQSGGLTDFVDIAVNYLPLYAALSGGFQAFDNALQRITSLIASTGGFFMANVLLVPTIYGISTAALNPRTDYSKKRIVLLLAGLGIAFTLSTIYAGKFWPHHWLPLSFVMTCLSAIAVMEPSASTLSKIVVLVVASQLVVNLMYRAFQGPEIPNHGSIDLAANYLETHLKPGDKVQPMDWTGGALHAMLIANVEPATRFVSTGIFYHDISTPYIQGLQKEFIAALEAARPRIVLEFKAGTVKPSGRDTSEHFEAFEKVLRDEYTIGLENEQITIYERKP